MKKLITSFVSVLFVITLTAQSQLPKFEVSGQWQFQNYANSTTMSYHQGEINDVINYSIIPLHDNFPWGDILSYNWSFPGGIPSTSTLATPNVVYPTLGTFSVSLVVHTVFGDTTIFYANYMHIKGYGFCYPGLNNSTFYIQSFSFNGNTKVSGQGHMASANYGFWNDPLGSYLLGFQDYSDSVYMRDVRTGRDFYCTLPKYFNPVFSTVYAGQKYPFTINSTFLGNPHNMNIAVWMDANYNGVYETSELVYSFFHNQSTSFSDSVLIPFNCYVGKIKMRVMMADNNNPYPCEAAPYFDNWNGALPVGEAEDYTLNVLPPSNTIPIPAPISNSHGNGRSGNGHGNNIHAKSMAIETNDNSEEIIMYPNPVKDELTIEGNYVSYIIFSNDGAIIKTGFKSDKVQTYDLAKGVYFIRIFGDNVVTNKLVKL